MGFFSRLFGRSPSSPSASRNDEHDSHADLVAEETAPSDPPELIPAIAALKDNAFEKALEAALPYVEAESPAVRTDANRLCALSLSRLDRYEEAFAYWLNVFSREESVHNALQLATSSVMCDELERGKAWLAKADELNEKQREMSPVALRINFISALSRRGHFHDAFDHLQWMKTLYEQLHITDSTFLYLRNVPFFTAFLENSLPITKAVLSPEEAVRWYASMREHLDTDGQEEIDRLLHGGQLENQAVA